MKKMNYVEGPDRGLVLLKYKQKPLKTESYSNI